MPVNDRYPLAEVLDACRADHAVRRRTVFIEYVMLAGVNDRYEQALALARLLSPRQAFKVNLIPYNPTDSRFAGSGREAIAAFRAALESRGVPVTVRLRAGARSPRPAASWPPEPPGERAPTVEQSNELAEGWRPFRTWTTVLLRLAGDREFGRGRARS